VVVGGRFFLTSQTLGHTTLVVSFPYSQSQAVLADSTEKK